MTEHHSNRSVNNSMKDAERNNPFDNAVMNPLLSVLERWIDTTIHRSASGGSTDSSSSSDEDETITFVEEDESAVTDEEETITFVEEDGSAVTDEEETITFVEEDGSAVTSDFSTIGSKLDRISFKARRASPIYTECFAETAFSTVDRSIQSSMGPSVQSSMGRSSSQSFLGSVQSSVEASIQQIYDARELRKPKSSSRKLLDKNRPLSIRERFMQGENRHQSEEGRRSPNEPGSAKEIQVPMHEIFYPKLWSKYKSKKWTKRAKNRSSHGILSYEATQDDMSFFAESALPKLATIPEAKGVVRTDSAAKSHASSSVETETLMKESSDLACNLLQLSLPEKNMKPQSGDDDDLASTQGYEAVLKPKLSEKFSFLPWVKSERDSIKVMKSTIPGTLPIPRSQKPDKSQHLKRKEDGGKGKRDKRKVGRRSFNPLMRSASKKSGKTANVCISKDMKSNALRSASNEKKQKANPVFSRGSMETCSTSHLDSQENECKGASQKSLTQERSSPQTTVSAAQASNKMKDTFLKAAELLEPPTKSIPLTTQKSELCDPIKETMDKPTNEEIGANRKEQEDKLVEIALAPHLITTDVEPDDKMQTKGDSLRRKAKSVRSAPAEKRRMFGFLRKRSSQEVKSNENHKTNHNLESNSHSTSTVRRGDESTPKTMPSSKIGAGPTAEQKVSTGSPKAPASTVSSPMQTKGGSLQRKEKSVRSAPAQKRRMFAFVRKRSSQEVKSNENHKTYHNLESNSHSTSTVRRGNESTPKTMPSSKIGAGPTAEQKVSTGSPKAPASTVSSPINASPAAKRLVASLKESDKEKTTTRRGNLSPLYSCHSGLLLDATTTFESKQAAKKLSPLAKKTAHYTAKINAREKDETKEVSNEIQKVKELLQIPKSKRMDPPALESLAELYGRHSSLLEISPEKGPTPKSAASITSGSRTSRKKGWTGSDEKRMLQAMSEIVQQRLKELEVTRDGVRVAEGDVKEQELGLWMRSFFQCGTGNGQQIY